jgi:hypothetical protein
VREQSKTFFFEKKKQKTFANLVGACGTTAATPACPTPATKPNVFWFFFSKKNVFLAYPNIFAF